MFSRSADKPGLSICPCKKRNCKSKPKIVKQTAKAIRELALADEKIECFCKHQSATQELLKEIAGDTNITDADLKVFMCFINRIYFHMGLEYIMQECQDMTEKMLNHCLQMATSVYQLAR